MMNTQRNDFLEYDFDQDDYVEQTKNKAKGKTKLSKRKWREIENIKEQRRFKNELASYEVCNF